MSEFITNHSVTQKFQDDSGIFQKHLQNTNEAPIPSFNPWDRFAGLN